MTSTAHLGIQEIAETQILFRTQNERIQASADAHRIPDPVPFICECADGSCTDLIRLSFDQYETIRAHPRRFFNVSGHEAASVAAGAEVSVVVAQEFTVVEKIGVAGEIAAEDRGREFD